MLRWCHMKICRKKITSFYLNNMCLHTFIDCTNGNLKVVQEGSLRKASQIYICPCNEFLRQQIKKITYSMIQILKHVLTFFNFISVFRLSGK